MTTKHNEQLGLALNLEASSYVFSTTPRFSFRQLLYCMILVSTSKPIRLCAEMLQARTHGICWEILNAGVGPASSDSNLCTEIFLWSSYNISVTWKLEV